MLNFTFFARSKMQTYEKKANLNSMQLRNGTIATSQSTNVNCNRGGQLKDISLISFSSEFKNKSNLNIFEEETSFGTAAEFSFLMSPSSPEKKNHALACEIANQSFQNQTFSFAHLAGLY